MRYSILLPTHNRADVLKFALQSIFAQTEASFEVLVVGDGCTDGTADVVNAFDDPRILWYDLPKAPNFGYANRNIALKEARGELVAFLGHDDLWFPDHLALLYECFTANPGLELAYTMPVFVHPDGQMLPLHFNLHDDELRGQWADMKRNVLPAGCVVHRRSCFAKYGYWDETLPNCGDWELWARIMKGGGWNRFRYLPVATCLHFRAIWRRNPVLVPHEVAWHADNVDELRCAAGKIHVDCSGYDLEQEAVWHHIKEGGGSPVSELRNAMAVFLHRGNLEMAALSARHERMVSEHRRLALANLMYSSILYNHGIAPPEDVNAVSFYHFLEDGELNFWVTRDTALLTPGVHGKTRLKLFLCCGDGNQYSRFPFTLSVLKNDREIKTLLFDDSGQCRTVLLNVDKTTRVTFQSDGWLIVNETEASARITNITIGRERRLNPHILLKRIAASLFKHERKPV